MPAKRKRKTGPIPERRLVLTALSDVDGVPTILTVWAVAADTLQKWGGLKAVSFEWNIDGKIIPIENNPAIRNVSRVVISDPWIDDKTTIHTRRADVPIDVVADRSSISIYDDDTNLYLEIDVSVRCLIGGGAAEKKTPADKPRGLVRINLFCLPSDDYIDPPKPIFASRQDQIVFPFASSKFGDQLRKLDGTPVPLLGSSLLGNLPDFTGALDHLDSYSSILYKIIPGVNSDGWTSTRLNAGFIDAERPIGGEIVGVKSVTPVFYVIRELTPNSTSILPSIGLIVPKGQSVRLIQRPPWGVLRNPTDTNPPGRETISWTIELPIPDYLPSWNQRVVLPYVGALLTVQSGSPISYLPLLDLLPGAKRAPWNWVSIWHLADSDPGNTAPNSDFRFDVTKATVEPVGAEVAVHFNLPNIRDHNNDAVALSANLNNWHTQPSAVSRSTIDSAIESDPFGIRFYLTEPSAKGTFVCRIGALDLTFGTDKTQGHLAVQAWIFRDIVNANAGAIAELILPQINLSGLLPVSSIAPGGQDDLPNDVYVPTQYSSANGSEPDPADVLFVREPPVVLDAGAVKNLVEGTYALSVNEQTADHFNQTLRMQLLQVNAPSPETLQLIVIDRQPFSIALVKAPPLAGQQTDDGSSEIANWQYSELSGPKWQFRGAANGFTLFLPPQGVGEQAEKKQHDIEERATIDFRFSPPAQAMLQSSFNVQRYAEAPWNLRRILGYPGQTPPGATVSSMQFELLYGLKCNLTYPFLRLTELFAQLGAVPERLATTLPWESTTLQNAQYNAYRKTWANAYARYLSRLAIYAPWDDHLPEGLVLSKSRDEGTNITMPGLELSYELRAAANLKNPFPSPPTSFPASDEGLAGGVAWGFESANVLNSAYATPKSSSATLADPYFSALGGWGFQKAKFDQDLTTIYANTAMGRTFYYSIERLGRIAIFWNLAKHVVVYERTTAPAPQFSRVQDQLLGRPVLRKVREYIEILEPKRRYPDNPAHSPASNGFVLGCEFKDRIINVDGSWGHDIDDGWVLPLWDKDAAAQQKDIYPQPHVVLHSDCDPLLSENGNGQTVAAVIDEPEKLWFFTQTSAGQSSDPHEWPLIRNVDFPDFLPIASPRDAAYIPASPAPTKGGRDLETQLPNAIAIEPGYERYTLSVSLPNQPINVVSARASQFIGAAIHNVTMIRNAIPADPIGAAYQVAMAATQVIPAFISSTIETLISRLNRLGDATLDKDSITPLTGLLPTTIPDSVVQALSAISAVPGFKYRSVADVASQIVQAGRDAITAGHALAISEIETRFAQISQGLEGIPDAQASATAIQLATEAFAPIERLAPILAGLPLVSRTVRISVVEVGAAQSKFQKAISIIRANWISGSTASIRQTLNADRNSILAAVLSLEPLFLTTANFISVPPEEVASIRAQTYDAFANTITNALVINAPIATLVGYLDDLKNAVNTAFKTLIDNVNTVTDVVKRLDKAANDLRNGNRKLRPLNPPLPLASFAQRIIEAIPANTTVEQLRVILGHLNLDLSKALDAIQQNALNTLNSASINVILGDEEVVFKRIKDLLQNGSFISSLVHAITNACRANWTTTALCQDLQFIAGNITSAVDPFIAFSRNTLTALARITIPGATALFQKPAVNGALRLLRAFGDAPNVPALNFNRDQLAYYFGGALADAAGNLVPVLITPVTALVNRAGNDLKALGMRLPTSQLLDRCIPDALNNFQLSDILPDFAGLRLENLFSGLNMPAISNNNITVTHGFDRQTLRAWLKAEVKIPIDAATLFSFGPVAMRLNSALFLADASVDAGAGGAPQKTASGSITGDWSIQLGGENIVTFANTSLSFDQTGQVRFNLSPAKVQFNGIIKFLSDLISKFPVSDSGFSIRPITLGAIPAGIESLLKIHLPNIQEGTTGISNLLLSATFGLQFLSEDGNTDFSFSTSFALGRKVAPFNISIFILGGGGFLEIDARYWPLSSKIQTSLTIGVTVSASLAFSLGPINGGIYAGISIYAEFDASSDAPAGMALGATLLLRGDVDVAGLVSATIYLLLEIRYQVQGSQKLLDARGTLSISIKICWCFTFDFSSSVEYQFATSGGSKHRNRRRFLAGNDVYLKAATDYVNMFN